ncbi:unnamed protein product, partial [Discosporangium mesarthrocarpum]
MLQPDSRGTRSYYEAFTRRRSLTPEILAKEKVLTDRGEYTRFLEVQLERVSAACLASQDFSSRINALDEQAETVDEKMLSLTKLVRLAQTYSEEQGREQSEINAATEQRLELLERAL